MPRSIFVNLVVSDLPRTMAFFRSLGMDFNPQFSNDDAAGMIVSETAYFMLHTPKSMQRFSSQTPYDPTQHTAAIFAFSVENREAVDTTADVALASGGSALNAPQDHGFMYLRSFRDPDGHPWEVFWMDPAHLQ